MLVNVFLVRLKF